MSENDAEIQAEVDRRLAIAEERHAKRMLDAALRELDAAKAKAERARKAWHEAIARRDELNRPSA